VGIHPSTSPTVEDTSEELKTAIMVEFGCFNPRIRKIISMSSHIKRWPLFVYNPLPTWVRGHVLLIGNAAHPILPFTGQGATQAMEDGAALGALLKDHKAMNLDHILSSFEAVHKNRTARVQILSSVRAGLETQVTDKLAPYLDEMVPVAPASLIERVQHDFRCVIP
jgi:salicylate hydroxylase